MCTCSNINTIKRSILYEAVLDAVEGSSRRKEKDFFDMWHTVVFDLAHCHIKLFTNIKALEYLQLLVGSNQDSSYRLGAVRMNCV
jgi:hypothetical protein